jgi:cellulose synthase/poly-beta-1,6-N-acetylglucosamine synthase-like glycosyltransferase
MTPPSLPSLSVVIPRRGINDEHLGKKHALRKLISAAQTDYVWMRDDDVTPPAILPKDMALLLCRLGCPDLLILPLRMEGNPERLIERLQTAEYAAIQAVTMQTATEGRAVMCSGANLIVRRDRWLESYEELHPELPSGDDMFLLESFKRRGLRITAWDSPEATAVVRPCPTLRTLLRQRMRWAGKAGHYTDGDIRRYGLTIAVLNLLQAVFPPILLLKFPYEYRLIKTRDRSVSLITALLLEAVYPWYMLICLIGGLLSAGQKHPQF